jgi:hypothetical protein
MGQFEWHVERYKIAKCPLCLMYDTGSTGSLAYPVLIISMKDY